MQTKKTTHSSSKESALDQCNSYIRSLIQDRRTRSLADQPRQPGPAITISYQAGAGAHEIARLLARHLQSTDSIGNVPWTVFDHHLVEQVLEEHHLPQSLAKFMPEERRSYLQEVIEDLAGIRPPSWVTVPLVTETVLHLADSGRVVLVGRGANVITDRMPNVFHVRLIAPLPARIAWVQLANNLTEKMAAKFVVKSDRARGRYALAHFNICMDDDLLYHLVINTGRIPIPDAVELIAGAARRSFQDGAAGTNHGPPLQTGPGPLDRASPNSCLP
jgi:cytidylate kinase